MSEVLTFLSGLFLLLLGLGGILLGLAISVRVINRFDNWSEPFVNWFSPEAKEARKEARAKKALDKLCAANPHLERREIIDEIKRLLEKERWEGLSREEKDKEVVTLPPAIQEIQNLLRLKEACEKELEKERKNNA